MPSNVLSGARARFMINGEKIAFCAGVSSEETVDYEPVDTLDLLQVREYVPVHYRTHLSASFFRLVGSPLKDYAPKHLAIFPKTDDILTSGEMQAVIQDMTGVTIAQFEQVKAANKTMQITSRGVVAENCSFVAIKVRDEAEIQ